MTTTELFTLSDECEICTSITVKRSRFIAHLRPVTSADQALAYVAHIKTTHKGARHNVYAYRLSEEDERCSDDAEPAKTAGLPTLQALRNARLIKCICVTTRYFGGVLLGTGGLARAYGSAAQKAIHEAKEQGYLSPYVNTYTFRLIYEYRAQKDVRALLHSAHTRITHEHYGDEVSLEVALEYDADFIERAQALKGVLSVTRL